LAVKNSTKRRPACGPRAAISAGTGALVSVKSMALSHTKGERASRGCRTDRDLITIGKRWRGCRRGGGLVVSVVATLRAFLQRGERIGYT
jgi:hypothetical protein